MRTLLYGSGLLRRVGAWAVDTLLFALAGALLLAAGGVRPFGGETVATVAAHPLTFLVMWPYFALMESSRLQATVGKYVCRIRVVDLQGGRISFGRATGRYFARLLSGLLGTLGILMILFTKLNQSLHDMMTRTVIIEYELYRTLQAQRAPLARPPPR